MNNLQPTHNGPVIPPRPPRRRQNNESLQPPSLLTTSLENARASNSGAGPAQRTPVTATTLSSPFSAHRRLWLSAIPPAFLPRTILSNGARYTAAPRTQPPQRRRIVESSLLHLDQSVLMVIESTIPPNALAKRLYRTRRLTSSTVFTSTGARTARLSPTCFQYSFSF